MLSTGLTFAGVFGCIPRSRRREDRKRFVGHRELAQGDVLHHDKRGTDRICLAELIALSRSQRNSDVLRRFL